MSAAGLAAALRDARARTLALVEDLDGEQLLGPRLDIVNPPLWELGHIAWFQEFFLLRHTDGRPPLRADADPLWDSITVGHATRWDLPLPGLDGTLAYMEGVLEAVLERLERIELDDREHYLHHLVLGHEDMHGEAFTYTRQTCGYSRPRVEEGPDPEGGGPLPGDVEIAGGRYELGARPEEPFVFDNERWAHWVDVAPFRLARAPVTQGEYAAFVDDGGYERDELWTAAGLEWRRATGARHPMHWRPDGGGWTRMSYDRPVPLEPHRPVLHVCAHEVDAYCRWAGRRLPTEAEWELAASTLDKRRFPWGDGAPDVDRAQLDGRRLDVAEVGSFAAGESPDGCRHLIGGVWEWTATTFRPYPGFSIGPYREYSAPWFGDHRVLRGGCLATRGRLLRNTWRNFYTPDRRDVFAGFRTAADE